MEAEAEHLSFLDLFLNTPVGLFNNEGLLCPAFVALVIIRFPDNLIHEIIRNTSKTN